MRDFAPLSSFSWRWWGRIFCFLAVLPSGFQGDEGRMSGRPHTLVVLGFPRSGKGESEMALNDELRERIVVMRLVGVTCV